MRNSCLLVNGLSGLWQKWKVSGCQDSSEITQHSTHLYEIATKNAAFCFGATFNTTPKH